MHGGNLRVAALGCAVVLALGAVACGSSDDGPPLSGSIQIGGSTTMAPLTEAVAKRFMAEHPDVHVTVGTPGADRGFEQLCEGETDASDAADTLEDKEIAACERGGWGEIAVANDAVVVFVDPMSPIRCLTTEQLRQIWHGNSEVTEHWRQVDGVQPGYDGQLIAWGPGTETETFDFFTKAVNGAKGETRDYNNSLQREAYTIEAVSDLQGAIGYARYGLYKRNSDAVNTLAVDSGDGCVAPSPETIADGTFRPFSRRLLVYPSTKALARPEMEAFLRFYLDNVETMAPQAGFIALTDEQLDASKAELDRLAAEGGS